MAGAVEVETAAGGDVIIESPVALAEFLTSATGQLPALITATESTGGFHGVMADVMDDAIGTSECSEGAARAGKSSGLLLGVAGGNVERKSTGVKKFFFTVGTRVRKLVLVAFEMVEHSILAFFSRRAVRANEEAGVILLIGVGHTKFGKGPGGPVSNFNFARRRHRGQPKN